MRLRWRRQTIRPRHHFATAQGGIDQKTVLIVELEHDGIVGYGEVVPSALYGQSIETSEATLEDCATRVGDDPLEIVPILDALLARHDGQRAAIAGIDSALHDWAGKRLGVPVWKLLGLGRAVCRTTFTIGIADPGETREKVREALAEGYDALKVKVGVEGDEQTLAMIREVFDGPLYLDANEGWSAAQAGARVRALAHFRPELIEQPLRREEWRAFGELREVGVAPIYADESCERVSDLVRLAGLVDGVNIKFTKCGGIREALRMIHVARALGLGVMLGCFVCSSLAIAPALSLVSLVDHADLDGHLLLAEDPFSGIARRGSTISLPEAPGLGVAPRPD
jgi:L-alanine-DL-glutamate epimerase-like enolase superfamily enzyme